ncbi:MAG: tRNA (guanine37-N1)-methyltransferase [Parcubacteria group bacterium Gr01-1014_33]|nr:MAG: tRNA (guanine37-N1)-methyltransferase [Parcubacteria group bacterium Gr01-1014_33]
MRFDILTLFPKIFDSYFSESIIQRAREKKLVEIAVHNVRDFAEDTHKKVDNSPYGGGPGMVLKIEPIVKAVDSILKNKKSGKGKTKIILFSAAGKQFNQKMARDFAKKYDRIMMIAGHYEGVDERVKKVVKDITGIKVEEISIGHYTLTGGELPVMILVDAISRHIPGVLGKEESLEENRFGIGLSVYTRPEVFEHQGKKYRVPKVLLSGDHSQIEKWRKGHAR